MRAGYSPLARWRKPAAGMLGGETVRDKGESGCLWTIYHVKHEGLIIRQATLRQRLVSRRYPSTETASHGVARHGTGRGGALPAVRSPACRGRMLRPTGKLSDKIYLNRRGSKLARRSAANQGSERITASAGHPSSLRSRARNRTPARNDWGAVLRLATTRAPSRAICAASLEAEDCVFF